MPLVTNQLQRPVREIDKLDLQALEQEMGFDVETTRPWWRRLIRRERRLVEFPRGNPISPPRASKCSDETAALHGVWLVSDETSKPLPIWRGTESSNPSPSSGGSCKPSVPERVRMFLRITRTAVLTNNAVVLSLWILRRGPMVRSLLAPVQSQQRTRSEPKLAFATIKPRWYQTW